MKATLVSLLGLVNGALATVQGFDISHYQSSVNFAAAYSAGARFVIIKVSPTDMSPRHRSQAVQLTLQHLGDRGDKLYRSYVQLALYFFYKCRVYKRWLPLRTSGSLIFFGLFSSYLSRVEGIKVSLRITSSRRVAVSNCSLITVQMAIIN